MITAVVLTKNNESTLTKTLQSLSWCDETLCIDDYSTDGTKALAKKLGAEVFERHLENDFAAQRNFGLDKAKHPWILFIDSDEIVTSALQEEIMQNLSVQKSHSSPVTKYGINSGGNLFLKTWIPGQARNDINAFYLKRTDQFLGRGLKYGETAHVKLLRLARKDAGIWKRPVHEYWDIQGTTGILENPLLHYPHENVAQFIKKINHYTTINANYLYKNNGRSNAAAIIFYPIAKFLWNYIFLLGFLDSTPGAVMAIMMSFHSFLTRAKLYLLYHKQSS